MNAERASALGRLLAWLPLLVMLGGFPAIIAYLYRLDMLALPAIAPRNLVVALLMQVVSVAVLVVFWQRILRIGAAITVSRADAVSHIGMLLVGKYVPGKVWGIVSRGVLLAQRDASLVDTLSLSLFEQGVLMHAGIVLALLAAAGWEFHIQASPLIAIVCAIVAGVSVVLVAQGLPSIIRALSWALTRMHSRLSMASPVWGRMAGMKYTVTLGLAWSYWLLITLVPAVLMADMFVGPLGGERFWLLLMAVPVAVEAGFLALWIPGGLGVREGVMVAILSHAMSIPEALTLALVFRVWVVATDLVLGLAAALILRLRQTPGSTP